MALVSKGVESEVAQMFVVTMIARDLTQVIEDPTHNWGVGDATCQIWFSCQNNGDMTWRLSLLPCYG